MNMYFIAVVLPEHLNERIIKLKTMMLDKFDCKVGLKSPAHITLVPPFWLEEGFEQELLQDTRIAVKDITPFSISTNNFSAFKPRTIFIDVAPNINLNNLKKTTDQYFGAKETYKVKIDKRPFHPHITIATRDLHKKAFFEAWPLFENKTFQEEWLLNGLSVLRHNRRNWDVIETASFAY